jgi:DNA-binding MarR family transcriptional regulator
MSITAVRRAIDAVLVDEHDMPLAWFDVLGALRDAGGTLRVGQLCEAVGELPSSFSRRLDRMEDEGLVERGDADGSDRRRVHVTITGDGRDAWREAGVVYRRALQQHFASRLTDTDIAALHRIIGKTAPGDPTR